MLRSIIICPDADLNERLEKLLSEIGAHVTRTLDRCPGSLELLRGSSARSTSSVREQESIAKALKIARELERTHRVFNCSPSAVPWMRRCCWS